MINFMRKKWNNTSIQNKMMITFLIPIIVILVMNVFMYININVMINRIDAIYSNNIKLNELAGYLTNIQNSTKEYLENKGSVALNNYYIATQDYRDCMDVIDSNPDNTSFSMMEKNILNQSERYLEVIDDTIQAKRGRNVEKYREYFDDANVLYIDLQNCLTALNNEQFKRNNANYSQLLTSLRSMEIITVSILILVGIINVSMLFFITRGMTQPLKNLSEAALQVADGKFDVTIDTDIDGDEIGVVAGAFDKMVGSIQEYIEELKDSMLRESELKEHELVMESRMKEVQLRSLQAQINPHFLFNTLNAGAQLAMMEEADKTTEFIENMADFFRYNIKKINLDASIAEEIEMVDKYIYILNVRFTGEINFEKDIDEEVLSVRVPSMILQPLIENSVNYGIRDIDWEGKISLRVYQSEGEVCLEVSDNGVGIEQDIIDKILSGTYENEKTGSSSNGIGLGNVIERLQIFTGSDKVLSIESEGKNKGSTFTIHIPMYL
ncbi:MAG: histidine kinase [Lachnospiraceae bacterium]|nr:histidine kinase [Lachnospiraceae bacterium]